jgi:hypothetical protein
LDTGKAILALHVVDTGTNSVTSVTIAGVAASAISGAEGIVAASNQDDLLRGRHRLRQYGNRDPDGRERLRAIGISVWLGNTSRHVPRCGRLRLRGTNVDEAMPLSLDVEDGDYILAAASFFDNTVDGDVTPTNVTPRNV